MNFLNIFGTSTSKCYLQLNVKTKNIYVKIADLECMFSKSTFALFCTKTFQVTDDTNYQFSVRDVQSDNAKEEATRHSLQMQRRVK